MTRVLAALAASLTLAACANVGDNTPSYLGMATASIDTHRNRDDLQTPEAVRHIDSNKVLGAMAFQKVTGAKVDPATLIGRRAP